MLSSPHEPCLVPISGDGPVAPSPTPGPGPASPGPDVDGDGNLDRWEYVGCFSDAAGVFDFESVDANLELTPIVSSRFALVGVVVRLA